MGRLPEPLKIFNRICELLPPVGTLTGKTVTVTAGPTREVIDPVRVITNLSSGRMGYALAEEARCRGAHVNLITGSVSLPDPPGIDVVEVESTSQLLEAVRSVFGASDILIMSAAPSDFRCRDEHTEKIKKEDDESSLVLNLVQNPDILKEISPLKENRIIAGFALETGNGVENASKKLREKNLDLIILNHPHAGKESGVGKNCIQGTLIDKDGSAQEFPEMTKTEFATVILDRLESQLS
jgi:phosphopantothenoylcysteine decarboxylase/phosphopantothenate--cysteine ligase